MSQKGDTTQLEIDFATDMLGDGDFGSGQDGWGFLNMVLSDTNGEPFTTHQDKVARRISSVDFVMETKPAIEKTRQRLKDFGIPEGITLDLLVPVFVPSVSEQKNQYPSFVAEWMWTQMKNSNINFRSNNTYIGDRSASKSFKELGWTGWFWNNVNLLELPQFGWNTKLQANYSAESLLIKRKGRKKQPDITLNYEDNRDGYAEHSSLPWDWGYNVSLYLPETKKKRISSLTPELKRRIEEERLDINFRMK
ncbi:MAG TPA: hypothetical protein DCM40_34035, partial [Maribacter sp.]|nr:hypothetical protein [Maribacter sp.]